LVKKGLQTYVPQYDIKSPSFAFIYIFPDYTNSAIKVNILEKDCRFITTENDFFKHFLQK